VGYAMAKFSKCFLCGLVSGLKNAYDGISGNLPETRRCTLVEACLAADEVLVEDSFNADALRVKQECSEMVVGAICPCCNVKKGCTMSKLLGSSRNISLKDNKRKFDEDQQDAENKRKTSLNQVTAVHENCVFCVEHLLS